MTAIHVIITIYNTSYPDRDGNPIYRADLPSGKRIKVVIKANTADHYGMPPQRIPLPMLELKIVLLQELEPGI